MSGSRVEREGSESDDWSLGTTFGDYQILNKIAAGGMGVVFRATQIRADRIVALKVIRSPLLDQQTLARFFSEVRAASQLDHPGIVPVYDVGEASGVPFYSMKFVEGRSLSQHIAGSPLSCREAARITQKIAEAIAFAHQRAVIHRDLKPGNILLDSELEPYVTDFGLAKRIDQDSEMTKTGAAIGTPAYMPPEQAAGENDKVGPHSDIYAIGAVLYACVTGRPPFQGATPVATLMQVIHDAVVPPSLLNTDVDRDINTICLKCLQKRAESRYESAAALAEDLARYLRGEPIVARPASTLEKALKWSRRHPLVVGLGAAILVALVLSVFSVTSNLYAQRLQSSLDTTESLRERAENLLRAEQRANENATRADYYRRIALAQNAWQQNRTLDMSGLLRGTAERYRHWEYLLLQDRLTLNTRRHSFPYPPRDLAVSRDGNHFVYVNHYGPDAAVWKRLNDFKTVAIVREDNLQSAAVAPDGEHVVIQKRHGDVRLMHGPRGVQVAYWDLDPTWLRDIRCDASCRWVVSALGNPQDRTSELRVLDVENHPQVQLFPVPFSLHRLQFADDSKTLYAIATSDLDPAEDWLVAFESGVWEPRVVDRYRGDGIRAFDVDDRAGKCAIAYSNGELRVLALGSFDVVAQASFRDQVQAVELSATGEVALGFDHGSVELWDAALSNRRRQLRGHLRSCMFCKFIPSHRERLLTASKDLSARLWLLDAPSVPLSVEPRVESGQIEAAVWGPDSTQLATLESEPSGARLVLRSRMGKVLADAELTKAPKSTISGPADTLQFIRKGLLLLVKKDGGLILWNTETGLEEAGRFAVEPPIESVAIDRTRGIFVAGSGRKVAAYDLGTFLLRGEVSVSGLQVRALDVEPGGDLFIASSQDKNHKDGLIIERWDFNQEETQTVYSRPYAYPTTIRAMNTRGLVTVTDTIGQLITIDVDSGEKRWADSKHLAAVRATALSPDQRRIVSCSERGEVWLRDADTGEIVITLDRRDSPVRQAAFSPDNQSLLVREATGKVTIWSITGQPGNEQSR